MIEKPVVIGKNVWIGAHVRIVPEVTIGDGAVVGMGCVVNSDVPALSIIGNQTYRVLGKRAKAHYESLESVKAYGGVNGTPLGRDGQGP